MKSNTLIRDAAVALNEAIGGLQIGKPIEASIGAARNWLEAARITSASEEEKDKIHLWECYALCLTNDYDRAFGEFQKANAGRELPRSWQDIGTFIYAKMTLPTDLKQGLQEYNTAVNWTTVRERHSDSAPVRAILYERKAFYHLKMNQLADAIACCEIATELLPDHLSPLRIMAEIKLKQGQYQTAIEFLSKVIAIRTEGPHFWDYTNRGTAFLETGYLQEAHHDFTTALQLEPQNPVLLSNLGMVLELTGKETQAWRLYSLALQSDFQSVPAHNNRGTLFFARQDYQQAEREFLTAVRLDPRNALLWFNLALSRFEMEMYGECVSDTYSSMQHGNTSWEAKYILAMCKGRLKDYSTAIAILQELVLKSSLNREDNSLIWNNIGVMEHRMDRLETAHSCFLASVDENPLNEEAQTNIDRIVSTMSGANLQVTEESQKEIAPRATTGNPLGLTHSDIINTVSIASSWASMASQYLT